MGLLLTVSGGVGGFPLAAAQETLPGTRALTESRPLDEVMVEGIDRFALREIEQAAARRASRWQLDDSSRLAHANSLQPYRERLAARIGAIDERVAAGGIERIATVDQSSLLAENDRFEVHRVRWPACEGLDAEGLFLRPKGNVIARVVAVPDADWTPEMIAGLADGPTRYAADLAACGCEVLVPTLINRDHRFSANPTIGRATNLTHREFIYRQAFELGRHIIGYEVQKVLAAIDQFERRNQAGDDLPLAVLGVSEGGLLAFYSAAIDPRIDGVLVSGYYDRREQLWREPIYRNVWRLLEEFGDAEIAGMIAPRLLYVEIDPAIPEVFGPPEGSRNIAAPGAIRRPVRESAEQELARAAPAWERTAAWNDTTFGGLKVAAANSSGAMPIDANQVARFLGQLIQADSQTVPEYKIVAGDVAMADPDLRQQRQVEQMTRFTQRLLQLSHRQRDAIWSGLDRSSEQAWAAEADKMRQWVHRELIGQLPLPTMAPDPRTRQILKEPAYSGYEVVLDVYPDVIASGILLLPADLKAGERRPVVVCQHGLEGTPMDTIVGPDTRAFQAYKSFSVELVKQGFIVYAPQNPYRGGDAFRTLQRKSNPLGRSLFSYIIPQHLVTLRWLASLPQVDADRIGFYGLSYGGKTAVRVPPLLPPGDGEPGYALSICSADFNEWVAKNASTDAPFSYVWTPEYEIFEWNMGQLANYAELSMLMAPRPFMVERGHDDGVGIDEWVAWEYAKVRRHYDRLGIGDRTEIEFFSGPHTIHGEGTYRFLRKHLNWMP